LKVFTAGIPARSALSSRNIDHLLKDPIRLIFESIGHYAEAGYQRPMNTSQ
jgi:hypothetical protein